MVLGSLKELARRVFYPTFDERLSSLERKIRDAFLPHSNADAKAVLIFCDPSRENLTAIPVPHGTDAKLFSYHQTLSGKTGRPSLSLVAALEPNIPFERQWSLSPGLLDDLNVLVRYPVLRIVEMQPPTPKADLKR